MVEVPNLSYYYYYQAQSVAGMPSTAGCFTMNIAVARLVPLLYCVSVQTTTLLSCHDMLSGTEDILRKKMPLSRKARRISWHWSSAPRFSNALIAGHEVASSPEMPAYERARCKLRKPLTACMI
jgi:hypothetical protein